MVGKLANGKRNKSTVNVQKIFNTKVSDKMIYAISADQIRLLLKEQSDQGLHCLLFHYVF